MSIQHSLPYENTHFSPLALDHARSPFCAVHWNPGFFALGFLMTGFPNAWKTPANWWPFVVTITNFISVQLAMTSSFKIPSNCWITPNQWEAKQSCANTELIVHSPDPIHLTRF